MLAAGPLSDQGSGDARDSMRDSAQVQARGVPPTRPLLAAEIHDVGLVAHEIDRVAVAQADLPIQCLDLQANDAIGHRDDPVFCARAKQWTRHARIEWERA